MKKNWLRISTLVLSIIIILLATTGCGPTKADVEKAYNAGVNSGTKAGFNDGYSKGLAAGDKQGYDRGYAIGYSNGKSAGRDLEKQQCQEDVKRAYERGAWEQYLNSGKGYGYDCCFWPGVPGDRTSQYPDVYTGHNPGY